MFGGLDLELMVQTDWRTRAALEPVTRRRALVLRALAGTRSMARATPRPTLRWRAGSALIRAGERMQASSSRQLPAA